jgi:hypothetical protein
MREDATSSENVLQENQGAPTMCELAPKVARTNVIEWRTPEDRDEKAGSSCIKIPQLDRRDNDVQSPQLKGPMIQSARDGLWTNWAKTEPRRAQASRPVWTGPTPSGGGSGPPFFGVKFRRGKPPFARDVV